ncbi:microtubule-associated futsch-like protein [Thalictrum thalictroides]|uniref:Microtubule-associated futsch-like protein n=1 Tax=Thalictrum thalictroides TaxID=46969 RepID=A0A7J6WHH0_THATH|nr:microtubule-associated futsch-like protein [Thalictrum thalictroides]
METVADQSVVDVNTSKSSKLRYPLRSASKTKEEISTSSTAKRGRTTSNVSKSVSVLDLSGKEKSAKPPRRLSIPTKSAVSPLPRPTGMITPISETRMKRSTNGQGKSGTPASDVSKSMTLGKSGTPASDVSRSVTQKKFNLLSSASYWLSQIKLSESAAKHSISLGFFKLALESGCEPLQRMRDELKSYAGRHNLVELGESVMELLKSYNIPENLEELQVSVTCSQVPEDGTRSSDEDVQSSSVTGAGKLKPKSLNSESFQASSVSELAKKCNKKIVPINKSRGSTNASSATKPDSNAECDNIQKKPQRSSSRQEANKQKAKLKEGKKDPNAPSLDEKTEQEDKENMDGEQLQDISLIGVA